MLRNIPFHLNVEDMRLLIWEVCSERVDFIYLPVHNRLGRNSGFAFVNFISTSDLALFYATKNGHVWSEDSDQVVEIVYAHCQGKFGLVHKYFINPATSVRSLSPHLPLIFHSDGPQIGKPETIDELLSKF
ncbi:hypothetical protein BDP27DRAFT_1328961 [Rhodocollybia butyracea]|uniref:Mei2-like C-terminal RNA recognition motif domain-containing protein n=1 Tax=Rhodocollybia butyracea TaxID=206335 RepID=A0A9P5PRL8_9AGAR|nr:hypothetical protein BDP27DRAFT_1328961 [Rhodocollybia butyracea]